MTLFWKMDRRNIKRRMESRRDRVGMPDVDTQMELFLVGRQHGEITLTEEKIADALRFLTKRHARHFGLLNKYGLHFKKV